MSMETVLERCCEQVQAWAASPAERLLDPLDVLDAAGPMDASLPDALIEARIQKAILTLLRAKLERTPAFNASFADSIGLVWLQKLVLATRLKELASVRIVRRGRKTGAGFDVTELANTYYGRKILEGLNITKRRRVLDAREFSELEAACAKIKLKLPETIEPTTTERFFSTP